LQITVKDVSGNDDQSLAGYVAGTGTKRR